MKKEIDYTSYIVYLAAVAIAILSLFSTGKEYGWWLAHTEKISHEDVMTLTKLSKTDYTLIESGKVIKVYKEFLDHRAWLDVKGRYNKIDVVGENGALGSAKNNLLCPDNLSFERKEKSFEYSMSKKYIEQYSKDDVEKCVVKSVLRLKELYDKNVIELDRLDKKNKKELTVKEANLSSWN